jgi:2-polyprenyl-3-methyl-5-hydroxy-6-metoxy-1,4-benzoquinol methylase
LLNVNSPADERRDKVLDNVDPREAQHYAALAETWWDRQGPFWPLHRPNVLRWLPRGTHRWDRFVTPPEVEQLLERGGLKVSDRTGVRVNPITRAFSLVRDLSVNFMVLANREAAA